jgi:hypothetical protein
MALIPTRHEVTGHECDFPEDTIPAWRQHGWIPLSELDETTEAARARTASTEEPTP